MALAAAEQRMLSEKKDGFGGNKQKWKKLRSFLYKFHTRRKTLRGCLLLFLRVQLGAYSSSPPERKATRWKSRPKSAPTQPP